MNIPDDRRYSSSHEWAAEEDGTITVGISDYAQDQLGDVVFVELPAVGRSVEAAEAVAVVESVKTASDIYAPVSGVITEVNDDLESRPELINASPYGDGWLFRLRAAEAAAIESLLDAAGYQDAIEADS